MSHTFKWSSLAALGVLTAVAVLGTNVKPAMAGCDSQYGQGVIVGSCQQSVQYSQQYSRQYHGRRNNRYEGCRSDGRFSNHSNFRNGYGDYRQGSGDNHMRRSWGDRRWQSQGRDGQDPRGQYRRWGVRGFDGNGQNGDIGRDGERREGDRYDTNDTDQHR